jgi:hypothetical protein
MTRKKKKLIKRDKPGGDSLNANMRQVARSGIFPLVTAQAENQRRHAGLSPDFGPDIIHQDLRGARKDGTDISE